MTFALPAIASAGSWSCSTPGTNTCGAFTVPSYETLTVTVRGGGGGGAGGNGSCDYGQCTTGQGHTLGYPGVTGGNSSFGSLTGYGGGGGNGNNYVSINQIYPSNAGPSSASPPASSDGSASGNGAGAAGGSGAEGMYVWDSVDPYLADGTYPGGNGGAGGSASATYSYGQLAPGSSITVVVGGGGGGGAGGTTPCDFDSQCGWSSWQIANGLPGSSGQNGSVSISWTSDPCPTAAPNPWGNGYLIYSGGTYRINSQGYDFCISNSSGYNYYVPARTGGELGSFVNAIPYLTGLTKF